MKKLIKLSFLLCAIHLFLVGSSAQTEQKAELVVQTGHNGRIYSIVFSPDGKLLASSGSYDKTIKIWDVETGQELRSISVKEWIDTIAFSPDGKMLAGGIFGFKVKIWDVVSGQELRTLAVPGGAVTFCVPIAFSPNGKMLATGTGNSTIILWDVETGRELKILEGNTNYVTSLKFSPDGAILSSGSYYTTKLWEVNSGKELNSFEGFPAIFSPDGKIMGISIPNKNNVSSDGRVIFFNEGRFELREVATGQVVANLVIPKDITEISRYAISPHTKIMASVEGANKPIKLWSFDSGQELNTLSISSLYVDSLTFSPNGNILASAESDNTIRLWNVISGEELKILKSHTPGVYSLAFSPNGKTLASGSGNIEHIIKLWDLESGTKVKTLRGHAFSILALAFSPDGKILASSSIGEGYKGIYDIRLWDVASGKELKTLIGHNAPVHKLAFSLDGKTLVSQDEGGINVSLDDRGMSVSKVGDFTIKFWDTITGKQLDSFSFDSPTAEVKVKSKVPDFDFSYTNTYQKLATAGGYKIVAGENGRLDLFRVGTEIPLVSLIALDENDWAVITPEGLFDASLGARKLMHYVIGLEQISLEQMKDLYYVPGLLQKILKGDPLPKVELFSKKDLFPQVEYEPLKPGQKQLNLKLTNRGGGIGQVQVLFNGKELIGDARPKEFDPNSPTANIFVDLAKASIKTGQENKIEIVARNSSGSLSTRGTRGTEIVYLDDGAKQTETPNVYAIVGGISNYTGDNLKLGFAAKDAEDFARALEIGATKLLGDRSKVHIRLLTSNGTNSTAKFDTSDAKITTATKQDFENAFADFKTATPNDVFIVYLAGHGISINLNQNPNQPGGDTYLYLTQEATTSDKTVLSIENSRQAMTISSDELKELMKQNKALKQVLILDTCASGGAAQSFVQKRDLPSDQIRAIERLKDNTGFYVLMGSAADAVSYEASEYGQGLLTYSLLQGMKGASLRENQFADVGLLFAFAQETVPNMAKNIGGIQQPRIITPDTSASFDIGKFTETEQQKIKLSIAKPLILRPTLQNKELDYDDLELTKDLQKKLREANFVTVRGGDAPLVFVDADEMVDAVKPSGSYIVVGDKITVTIRLIRNKTPLKTLIIEGSLSEREKLLDSLVKQITEAAKP